MQSFDAIQDAPALEQAVVRFIHEFRPQLNEERLRSAISCLLRDQLAVQIGGARLPWSEQVLAFAQARQSQGRSRILSSQLQMSSSDAAFVNAVYGHAFEYDDAHRPSSSHPGCCVVPVALAIGEELGSTLDEVMAAVVVGYEVYARIGRLAAPELIRRGFQSASVLSSIGAAAVAAKLRKLDPEKTLNALAIAVSHASGTTEYSSTGGSVKRLQPAIGVRGGLASADLASLGITGPRAFLTGAKGFFRTFLLRDAAPDAAGRFSHSQSMEIEKIWLKPYCNCGCIHPYIDAIGPFADRLPKIEKIVARIQRSSNIVVGTVNANAYEPKNIEHVQYSVPIQLAFALMRYGNASRVHMDYLAGKVDMASVQRVARLVQLVETPELDDRYPGKLVGDISVFLTDGSEQRVFVEDSLGTPENPMSEADQDEKFLELTSRALGASRARTLLGMLRNVDGRMNVGELTALCTA